MLSITSPGVTFGADPVEWARRVNESGARTVREHPGRFGLFAETFGAGGQPAGAIDVIGALQRLPYEVGAGFPFPRHIEALLNLVDVGRLMYGTDWPFGGVPGLEANTQALDRRFSGRERQAILRGTATALFPRLARS